VFRLLLAEARPADAAPRPETAVVEACVRVEVPVGEDEGKEEEGVEHSEESGGLVIDRGGQKHEDSGDQGDVSAVFPPSSTE
jgi:hypothetical protein